MNNKIILCFFTLLILSEATKSYATYSEDFFDGPHEIPYIRNFKNEINHERTVVLFSNKKNNISYQTHSWFSKIIECDNDVVYILSPLNYMGYLKGVYNEDHTQIIIENGSEIIYHGNKLYGGETPIYVNWYSISDDGKFSIAKEDSSDYIILNVNKDGSLSLEACNIYHGIGITRKEESIPTDLIVSLIDKPSTIQPTIINPSYEVKYYEMKYRSFNIPSKRRRLIAIASNGNETYIQGLCSEFPNLAVKGILADNKLSITNKQYAGLGLFREYLYFLNAEYENTQCTIRNQQYEIRPLESDFVFNLDPKTGIFSTNGGFGFLSNFSPTTIYTKSGDEYNNDNLDVYYDKVQLIPISENQEPLNPSITFNENELTVTLPGTDKNDVIMKNLNNLYVKVYIDDELQNFETISGNIVEELPYYLDTEDYFVWGHSSIYNYLGTYSNPRSYGEVKCQLSPESKVIRAQAVYYFDKKPIITESVLNVEESNIIDIESEQFSTMIYDLAGRQYKSNDNLSPGLYIQNGKKIIVK